MTNDTHVAALRAIVGTENARGDRAAMAAYAWNGGVGAMPGPPLVPDKQWPCAVVMPRTTDEVAEVVRYCNRADLRFRALGGGVGAFYVSRQSGVVVIDLCRMDGLTIDADNQMALIEAGVTAGRLQAAAMRHGLTPHIVGAGPSHSPLASATSFIGIGLTGSSTGHNARNMLSIEWVSPTGEIVRIGTDDDRWFSEEGPGPGFRGMIRGFSGAMGGLGVFTRIGYKLHPWAGPAELVQTGSHPQIGMQIPERLAFYFPVWDTLEAMTDASFRLNRAEVAFAMLRMPPSHIGWTLYETNGAYARAQLAGDLPPICRDDARFHWQIVTMGHSAEQAAVQDKTIRHIVAETGGRLMSVEPAHAEILTRALVTSVYVGRVARGSSGGATSAGVMESFGLLPAVIRSGERLLAAELIPGGNFATDTKDGFWVWPNEGRYLWAENIVSARSRSAAAMQATMKAFLGHFGATWERPGLGSAAFLSGPLLAMFGHRIGGVDRWLRAVKRSFDPNNRSEAGGYVGLKEPPFKGFWPLVNTLLFARRFPFLTIATKGMGKASVMPKPPVRPRRQQARHE